MSRFRLFSLASLLAVLAIVLSACSAATPTSAPPQATEAGQAVSEPTQAPEEEPTSAPEPTAATEEGAPILLPEVDPSTVEGDVITAGSSTVFPLSERMAELFQQEGYTGNITVDSIGTGAGFERFCTTGETDISNASRPIKAEEVANCQALGRSPLEFRVGTDALAVVVSAQNDFTTELTLDQLRAIFAGEADTWAEVNPAWPAEAIQLYSPGTDSGTFDYFVEAVLEKNKDLLLGVEGAQFSEDDNVLVQGVEGSPYAIGYFGYAYFAEASGQLKAVAIDGVAPSQETVDAGTYPLSRPLFIYSDPAIMADKPQVAAFIGFYLQHVNDEILDVGYFPAPTGELQASMDRWAKAVMTSN